VPNLAEAAREPQLLVVDSNRFQARVGPRRTLLPPWVGSLATRYGRNPRAAHPARTRRTSRENTNHGLSSIMLALVHTLNRNSQPVTRTGSRQGRPLAWHSAWAAASTWARLRALDRATLASLRTASECALMPPRVPPPVSTPRTPCGQPDGQLPTGLLQATARTGGGLALSTVRRAQASGGQASRRRARSRPGHARPG
jgi:hypothetical protein